ncbi:hypothetical protein GF374_03665 [Candidatus Woesearchaeota archaeon]|nr:hypothetical protein [Candidatus Woesearchaeota archaeon]
MDTDKPNPKAKRKRKPLTRKVRKPPGKGPQDKNPPINLSYKMAKISKEDDRLAWLYVFSEWAGDARACYVQAYPDRQMTAYREQQAGSVSMWPGKIRERIGYYTQMLQEQEQLSAGEHMLALRRIREKALSDPDRPDYKAAARCEELRGRVAGHYITRINSRHEHIDLTTTRNELTIMLQARPDILADLAGDESIRSTLAGLLPAPEEDNGDDQPGGAQRP